MNIWEKDFKICAYNKKLLDKILYLNSISEKPVDILEIKKAIYYAHKYHGNQTRQSGEPYYTHPIEVAIMAADHSFDKEIIIAALLHDIVEDTKVSLKQIKFIFGDDVSKLVDIVTKVTLNYQLSKAETLSKIKAATNQDKKAIIIKLLDRLHNMSTLRYIKSIQKQKRIAQETLQFYIPLAKCLNMPSIEQELKTLASKILDN